MRYFLGGILVMCFLLEASAAFAAPPAPSAHLSYTNVDVGLISTDLNDTDLSGDGLLLRGNLAITDTAFAFAQFQDIGYGHGVDGTLWSLGAGGHWPITKAMDLVGKLGYVRQNIDNGGSHNEDGYTLSATVRGFVMDKLEMEGGLKHEHLTDSGNNTTLIGEGRYFLTSQIAASALLQVGDTTTIGVYVRFTF